MLDIVKKANYMIYVFSILTLNTMIIIITVKDKQPFNGSPRRWDSSRRVWQPDCRCDPALAPPPFKRRWVARYQAPTSTSSFSYRWTNGCCNNFLYLGRSCGNKLVHQLYSYLIHFIGRASVSGINKNRLVTSALFSVTPYCTYCILWVYVPCNFSWGSLWQNMRIHVRNQHYEVKVEGHPEELLSKLRSPSYTPIYLSRKINTSTQRI